MAAETRPVPVPDGIPSSRSGLLGFIGFVATLVKMNFKTLLEYRASLISQGLFMALNNAIYLVFWWVFFNRFSTVAGWGMKELLTLFSVACFAFGLANILAGNASKISAVIAAGGLDSYLTLPRDPLIHLSMSRTSASAVGDLVFGILLLTLFCEPGPWGFAAFFLIGTAGALVYASFAVIAHSLSFFFGPAEGFGRLLQESVLTLSIYPESIYGPQLRIVMYTLIPAGFLTHLPVSVMRAPSIAGVAIVWAAALGWALAAWLVFRAGLRRYESGSMMGTRM